MSKHSRQAAALLVSCQLPGFETEPAEQYPAQEDGVNSIGNALLAAQVHATLAVARELRRSNDARDEFYREVIATLRAFRETEG